MKIILAIFTIIGFLLSTSVTLAAEQTQVDHAEIIKQKCKEAQTNQKFIESWAAGLLSDYNLILDHLEIKYREDTKSETTDGKILLCGKILVIGYATTQDGQKKRVLSLRSLCHLFNKEVVVEKVVIMEKYENKVISGWDEAIMV